MNPSVWDAYFWVEGVDELFEVFRDAGARIQHAPLDKAYGVREFVVRDLDGYQIAFGQTLDGR